MNSEIDLRIRLQASALNFIEIECPVLRELVPEPNYIVFPRVWECGAMTYDWLTETILDSGNLDETERASQRERLVQGKYRLMYRDVPIERVEGAPEHRLWPT